MSFKKKLTRRLDRHGGPLGLAKAVVTKPMRMAKGERVESADELRQRVEEDQAMRAELPTEPDADGFVAVGPSQLVQEGKPGTFGALGEAVAIYRDGGKLYAIDSACTHEDGPLGESDVIDGVVTCPYHDWRFRLSDGECLTAKNRHVACFAVKEAGGFIWLGPRTRDGSDERGGEHDDGLEMV